MRLIKEEKKFSLVLNTFGLLAGLSVCVCVCVCVYLCSNSLNVPGMPSINFSPGSCYSLGHLLALNLLGQ